MNDAATAKRRILTGLKIVGASLICGFIALLLWPAPSLKPPHPMDGFAVTPPILILFCRISPMVGCKSLTPKPVKSLTPATYKEVWLATRPKLWPGAKTDAISSPFTQENSVILCTPST